ncbi:MAG: sigma-E factor regulatory protein RseB domain-containing protein [Acidimicrobiia bacterium]
MIRRVADLRVALVAAALASMTLSGGPADAGTPDRAEELLARARTVASHESFAGIVEVRWHDDTGAERVERVVARGVEGAFVIGLAARKTVGEGGERYTSAAGEPSTRWEPVGGRPAPAPGATWDLEIAGRRRVAERPATVVVARDAEDRVRAKFSIDRETGQLLRRAVFDERGRAEHIVRFVTIITGESQSPPSAVPSVPGATDVKAPRVLHAVPAGFVSRSEVGPGYELLGRYRQPDDAVHLYFSDGIFTLSVFESQGRVDWDGLPAGSATRVEGLRARSYSTAAGTIVVWGQSGLVLTAVGDGPPDAVIAVVADFSGDADDASWLDDVTGFVLGPFDWE